MDEDALKTIEDNIYYVPIRRMLIDIERKKGNIDRVEKLLKEGMEVALKRNHCGTVTYYIEELLLKKIDEKDLISKKKITGMIEELRLKIKAPKH